MKELLSLIKQFNMQSLKQFDIKALKQFNMESVKKYRIDIIIAVVVIIGGVIFAQKPDIEAKVRLAKARSNVNAAVTKTKPSKEKPAPVETVQAAQPETHGNLETRNIFSPSGGYEITKDLKRIPENPYNLIAILHGKEKRVVLREFTGDLISVKVGSTLIDGGTVKAIGDRTVTIGKGDEVRELKIFDVKPAAFGKAASVVKGATGGKGATDTKTAGDVKATTKEKGKK